MNVDYYRFLDIFNKFLLVSTNNQKKKGRVDMFLKKGKREKKGSARRMLKAGLLSLLSVAMIGTAVPIYAAPVSVSTGAKADDSTVDFVLLLDCSGTMNENDKEGWTASATKAFVDFIGEDNTRLSVITFGPDYSNEDAYPVGMPDPDARNRVKEAFPLQDVTAAGKKEAKKVIDTETAKSGAWTPLGYALQAACDILNRGDSADNRAAIVLLSDGYVEGQLDYVDKKTKTDYKSVDKACKTAAEHGWPIYGMELNYKNKSQGKHIMREVLPGTYGNTTTTAYEVQSASKATAKLEEIYSSYFNTELQPITDGKFSVEEMTAEETLVLTGEVSKITSLELVSPSNQSEVYKYGDGDVANDERIVTFTENSATVKMIMPEEGEWTLKIDGREQVTLDLEINAISLKEMNLVLKTTDAADGDAVSYGQEINFESYFEYHGIRYESETFYNKYPAVLTVSGQKKTMNSTSSGYTGSCRFEGKGSFVVQSVVESNIFREGKRESGTFTFNVDNDITQPNGEVPEQTCGIGETTAAIDLNEYFKDADPLTFSAKKKTQLDDYSVDVQANGTLTLTAGNTSDTFEVFAYANDGSGEEDAVQKISFKVSNNPIMLIGDDIVSLEMTKGDEEVLLYSEYFQDADGTAPDVRIVVEEIEDGIVLDDSIDGALSVKCEKPGDAKFTIVGIDGNTDTAMQFVLVDVTGMSGVAAFVKHYTWLLILLAVIVIAVIVFLIMMMTGKKIFGTWDITLGGEYKDNVVLSNFKSGKKATVRVDRILQDLDLDGSFPKATMAAGTRFNKAVFFKDLSSMDEVYVDGDPIEDFSKKNFSKEIRANHSIELHKDGVVVTFDRISM